MPRWHPVVTTAALRLLLAGWYFQEAAARNCCGSLGHVAVVVEIVQNHKCRTGVLPQLVQGVLHLSWCWNWKKRNQTAR